MQLISITHADEEIPCQLETEPAAGHAGGNLQEIGADSLEETSQPFLSHDHSHSIPDRGVFVSYPGHGVDLEASPQHITRRKS